MNGRRREPPDIEFTFRGEPKPGEIQELLAKRDAILREMGYLPPDADHEYWWSPEEETGSRFHPGKTLKRFLKRFFP